MSESHTDAPIGLRRSTVVVRAYDVAWPDEYERAAAALARTLAGVGAAIEHIGSTAVPGLVAKPIIDIAVGLPDWTSLEEARRLLSAKGYEDQGDLGDDDGGVFMVKGFGPEKAHYLHLVEIDSGQWRGWIAFREALRADATLRERYAALKLDLATRFARDRASYTAGKGAFIREALRSHHRPRT